MDDATRAQAEQTVNEIAAKGYRALGVARNDGHGWNFLGLLPLFDPPREDAAETITSARAHGVRIKMVTGDNLAIAKEIAAQLGLGSNILAVNQLGLGDDGRMRADLSQQLMQADGFAQVFPEHKFALVKALQDQHHLVGMTGDGVNDAPALKKADIGVAMGITGTDVAKGAADMLLTDDNFASIEAAVEEGRGVFDNLTKFIIWTLPTNGGEALILLSAIFLGTALPALPVQLLWINMTTAILLGLMLVFEPKERDLMRRPPREPDQPILTYPLVMRTGLVTLLMLAGAFGAFLWEQHVRGKNLIEARTTVANVIVMVELFYLLNCRSLLHSMFCVGLGSNRWIFAGIGAMLGAQLAFTHLPIMNALFHTAPLDAASWLYITGVGLMVYCVVEFEKWVRRHVGRERNVSPASPNDISHGGKP
ncbi:MAG: HAD-IC family P-type ATPase [Candidatus Competibacteraceae bacterium]|nr:HAD-IC family P-type ATPase [Candidatus Competibacteraceae bacterium]